MTTIDKRIYDGNRAKEILENEVFLQVFTDIEQELIEAWKNAPQRDVEGREKIHQLTTLLAKVKAHLQSTFESGKLAETDTLYRQSILEKARDALLPNW